VRADRPISSARDSDALPLLRSGTEWRKIYARSAIIIIIIIIIIIYLPKV